MNITIQDANQVWSSPDGQRKIYQVTFTNAAGTLLVRKTYSDKLGTGKGQSFDIEEYSKDGRNGPEIFIKQVAAQNSPQQSSGSPTQYKADPEKQSSIERQAALKVAAQVTKDWYDLGGGGGEVPSLKDYREAVAETGEFYASILSGTPASIAQVMPGATVESDLPPVESYEPPARSSYQPPTQDSMV